MDIKLPNLGEGAESGTVVSIFVKPGDQIQEGQSIIELENEKAVAPIPASASGRVAKLYVKEGDKLTVGQPILALEGDGATATAPAAKPPSAVAAVDNRGRASQARPAAAQTAAARTRGSRPCPHERPAGVRSCPQTHP